MPELSARELFDEIQDLMLEDPLVQQSTMMGLPCLRLADKFFASFDKRNSALVVKLPRTRVDELISQQLGEPFAPAGRRFREWVLVPGAERQVWTALVEEAKAFASGAT
ncbi:hypothetical protein ACWGLF_44475 [Streptomyces puniciscabiei]